MRYMLLICGDGEADEAMEADGSFRRAAMPGRMRCGGAGCW